MAIAIDLTGRHVEITPVLRQLIDRRLGRLGRLLNDHVISAQAILSKEKYRHRTELIVHARGDRTLRGLGEGTTWPTSVRAAAEKIEQQAQTIKGKWAERKRRGADVRAAATRREEGSQDTPAAAPPRVVRATRYAVKPMSIDDAAARLDATDEAFVVFRGAKTGVVSILYRRKDGNLGLIEPD